MFESADRGGEIGQLSVAEVEDGEIGYCPELVVEGEGGWQRKRWRVTRKTVGRKKDKCKRYKREV